MSVHIVPRAVLLLVHVLLSMGVHAVRVCQFLPVLVHVFVAVPVRVW